MITQKIGDMFKEDADIYIVTVNVYGAMGKGVALQCKERYPMVYKEYKKDCGVVIKVGGDIHEYTTDDNKTILCVATKERWQDPSKYEWVKICLNNVYKYLWNTDHDQIVNMPLLGAGNGGLNKDIVYGMIYQQLDDMPQTINVYRI
jgi:O-acetyl-ADP-ribose deacetylase (regulator of RNase III)